MMPLAITASVDTTKRSVLLTVSGGTPPYAVTATPVGAAPYTLPSQRWVGAGTTRTITDVEARLNVLTQYSASDAASGTATTTTTVVSTSAVLSDALDPTNAVAVTVVSQDGKEREARTTTWDVIGRDDPAMSVAPMRLPAGELVLRVPQSDRAALGALLKTGSPLLLRGITPASVDDMTMAVQRYRDEYNMADNPLGDRLFRLTYQAVSRDLGAYVLDTARIYTTLLADASNYTDVLVKFDTFDDVRKGRRR